MTSATSARAQLLATGDAPSSTLQRRLAARCAARVALCAIATASTLVAIHGLAPVLLVPVACAVILLAGRLGPTTREPAVHDRQLDYLVSAAFFAVALWVAWAWPGDHLGVTLAGRACLVAGAVTLALGTRNATRLWPSFLALLVMAAAESLPAWVLGTLVVAAVAGAVVQLRRRPRTWHEKSGIPQPVAPLAAVVVVCVLVALPSVLGALL